MNKLMFFTGLGMILLEILTLSGFVLSQQSTQFINTFVLVVIVGGLNLAAVVMMLVGLISE